jgi:hypothetical protein
MLEVLLIQQVIPEDVSSDVPHSAREKMVWLSWTDFRHTKQVILQTPLGM